MATGTGNRLREGRPPQRRSVLAPALLGVALFAAAVGLVVWAMSPERTLGRLEHEETSPFSRIRVRRDGDVHALTFVRDNGEEVVQSRLDVNAFQTLVAFNINEHERIADDIAAVETAFGQAAVYRVTSGDNKVAIAAEGRMPADEELRARIGPLDARFGGALSFAELLNHRE